MNVVLGGGVGGLSAAYYLTKYASSAKVTLVEASGRVGGWVRTCSAKDNILFEQGPRTIRPRGPPGANTLALIEELGLIKKVKPILSSHPSARNRMLLIGGQLHKLPSSVSSGLGHLALRPQLLQPIIVHLWRDLKQQTRPQTSDESIYSFVERHLSKGAADYLISPLICGICAGDAKEISVKFLMKPMFEGVQEHGSILKWLMSSNKNPGNLNQFEESSLAKKAKEERWSVWSLDGGLENLPRTLHDKIQERNVNVILNQPCTQLTFDGRGAEVILGNGEQKIRANHIVSSLPACFTENMPERMQQASRVGFLILAEEGSTIAIVNKSFLISLPQNVYFHRLSTIIKDQHPGLSDELSAIPSVTVAVVNLAFKGDTLLKHNAFGFLVPPLEDKPILGVIFDSCSFPQDGHTVLTIMMGGKWFRSRFGESPSEDFLLKIATDEVKKTLGINEKPFCYKVSVLRDCIPQYVVGHEDRVLRIRDYVKKNNLPLSLVGAAYDGVGVNDVILSAKMAVRNISM